MHEFTQQIVNGLSLGAIYALIALGYTMVYGIIKLINFAHGDIMMVGAFVGYFSLTLLGTNIFVAMVTAMLTCAVLGVLIEKIAYRPLRNSTRIAALITAIGVSLFLEYTVIFLLGPSQKVFPASAFPLKAYNVGGLSILNKDVFVFVSAVVLMLILQYIIKWTKTGKAMRAVSLDREAALLMGISVDKTISITFAIGSALAAAAGVMVGVYYNTVNPLMGIIPGLKAFVAAVLGGIGIIPGAMVGGFVMGILETMVSGYGNSLYRDAVAFGVLILILLIKPSGIFGEDTGEKV
ncbi:MAG TPA: branched-chain amino acid ABC transporter permease [Bacillota bacterium]|mgnify:FL=1|nr:branched-chain amino acid ABC transporter permease [Peptococcaceae bacterium MAG4]NLW37736.1 branched-chain amino acid ABC transporter permease [Peptococcaceae bacterium]HPZ43199.1 branched-chain amino acid ABC transporter permease [Bacillota bacterium]HQD76055.1 branched-chain amino acid ABC transporter permease [Bacillota bacterium]HUM58453.1 branched-chain amino acid ABC transporter permease [Bacillota bacterium]